MKFRDGYLGFLPETTPYSVLVDFNELATTKDLNSLYVLV